MESFATFRKRKTRCKESIPSQLREEDRAPRLNPEEVSYLPIVEGFTKIPYLYKTMTHLLGSATNT